MEEIRCDNYWNKTFECMSREEMTRVQNERLANTVKRLYYNVPYYREKMQKKGIEPFDICSVDDLKKLPFTYKQDLRDNYPYGLFAVPLSEIVRIHASSGTTGKQTVVGYTRRDIDTWAEVMARTLASAGASKDSFIQVAYGYGLFTGGLGVHYGAERIGASVIPISGGNTKRQIQIMKDFGTTILACTPSYALYLAEEMREMGVKREELKLKAGVFGAEPWTEEMRVEIEKQLGILALDIYGLSEVIGPGVASDCPCKCGMHIQEDHFIPEIIDPDEESEDEGEDDFIAAIDDLSEEVEQLREKMIQASNQVIAAMSDNMKAVLDNTRVLAELKDSMSMAGIIKKGKDMYALVNAMRAMHKK